MDDETQDDKKVFLSAVKSILNARKGSMQLLRSTSLSNARVLERNSKSIKDPDPLSSALANNSLKWPITVNMDRLKKIENYNKDDVAGWDSRKYKRRQCSFRMVNKWITSDVKIKEIDENAIKKMFDKKSERVREIKSYDWSSVTFKIMTVNMERRSVKTNPMSVEIPRDIREEVITEVICGENVIEYQQIPEEYKVKVRELISEYHFEYASIPNLINFLKSQLDSKIRTLPTIPGMKANFIDVAHVLVQPRYRATNLQDFIGTEKGQTLLVSQACRAILLKYNESGFMNTTKRDVQSIHILGVPLLTLLKEADENVFVKSCKALAGLPIKPEITVSNMKLSPVPCKLIAQSETHSFSGLDFTVMVGDETVSFSSPHCNGSFYHNGTYLYSVTMMKVDEPTIRSILSKIASFIKVDIHKIRAKSMKMLKKQLELYHYRAPWVCVHSTKEEWRMMNRKLTDPEHIGEIRTGQLILVDNMDYVPSVPTIVTTSGDKGFNDQGQTVLSIPKPGMSYWADSINTVDKAFFKHLHPSIALVRCIEHIVYNVHYYLRCSTALIWSPPHATLLEYVEPKERGPFSATCREKIHDMHKRGTITDHFLFAVLYSFTAEDTQTNERTTTVMYNAKDKISIGLNEGVVLRQGKTNTDSVYGKAIVSRGHQSDIGFIYDGLVPGISFTSDLSATCCSSKVYSLKELENSKHKMPVGTKCKVHVHGNELIAVVNNTLPIETYNTVSRSIDRIFHHKQETSDLAQLIAGLKRKRDKEDEAPNESTGPSKKILLDTSTYGSIRSSSSSNSSTSKQ